MDLVVCEFKVLHVCVTIKSSMQYGKFRALIGSVLSRGASFLYSFHHLNGLNNILNSKHNPYGLKSNRKQYGKHFDIKWNTLNDGRLDKLCLCCVCV